MLQPFLKQHQITIGRDQFFDLLRRNKLLVRRIKRSVHTTNSKHHFRRYPNMVKDFTPLKAHEMWVADITYIPLKNRFAYLFLQSTFAAGCNADTKYRFQCFLETS